MDFALTAKIVCLVGCVEVSGFEERETSIRQVPPRNISRTLVSDLALVRLDRSYFAGDRQWTTVGEPMYLKKGVSLRGLQPEMVAALIMVAQVSYGDFVVTGGTEDAPKRLPNSLHKKGLAVDIRIPPTRDYEHMHDLELVSPSRWKARIDAAFRDTEYDVVWYDSHVHIEFDPK